MINESDISQMMWVLKENEPYQLEDSMNIAIADELVKRGFAENTPEGYRLTKTGEMNLMKNGGSIPQSAIEEGKRVELEHVDTIRAIKNNPYISVEDVAEAIAMDHLAESADYYKKLKIMEQQNGISASGCECPTMQYHNRLNSEMRNNLGPKYIGEGTTIKDTRTGNVADIVGVERNGFQLLPASSLSGLPRAQFLVPFEEIIDKHKSGHLDISGYGNTPEDHVVLVLVVKDIMACNMLKEIPLKNEQIEELNDRLDNEVEEEVDVPTMASGGIIGKVKSSRSGVIREVRDRNGKLLKEVYVGDEKYRRNPVYKTYNSISGNDLLFRKDADRIHMAYGGIVGVEEGDNFYRVDIASPKNVKVCRTPKWAQHAADSVKEGAKVTTCKKYGKWWPSAILVPKDGITASEAKTLGREIKDKIYDKRMENGGEIYETGATSWEVNNLILFADNTRNLSEMKDSVYSTIERRIKMGGTPTKEEIAKRFKTFLIKSQGQYIREMGNTKQAKEDVSLTPAQEAEFLNLYAEEFPSWILDNRGRDVSLHVARAIENIYGKKMERGGPVEIDMDIVRAIKYWGELNAKQRLHFLVDHTDYVFDKVLKDIPAKPLAEYKKLASKGWSELPKEVQMAIEEHVIMGTYENGGEISGYTPRDENESNRAIGEEMQATIDGILVLIDCTEDENEKEKYRRQLADYGYQQN